MPMEEALEELKKYAHDFELIGDAKFAIQNDKDLFIHKWSMVMKYFNYISINTPPLSPQTREAIAILTSVSMANPSLNDWIGRIISPSKYDNTNNKSFNVSLLYSKIDSLIDSLNTGISWDSEKANNAIQQLENYKSLVESNKSSIDAIQYRKIMNEINVEIYRINRKNQQLYEIAQSVGRGL